MAPNTGPAQAAYSIVNILLLESSFKREGQIDFETVQQAVKVDFGSGKNEATGELLVELSVVLTATQAEAAFAYEARVKMIGLFRKTGEGELDEDFFMNQNAPAIIFPFVREHITSLCRQAALNNVFLPPLNFTKRQ